MTTNVVTKPEGFRVEIVATTDIDAPAERVWEVLTDTARYPQWNPFIVRFEGEVAMGNRIEVAMKPGDRAAQTIRPRIVEFVPGESFTWLGHIGFPGVFDGRHSFSVEAETPATCRLVQSEVLSGALTPLFRTMLVRDTPRAFVALNEALAKRVSR